MKFNFLVPYSFVKLILSPCNNHKEKEKKKKNYHKNIIGSMNKSSYSNCILSKIIKCLDTFKRECILNI